MEGSFDLNIPFNLDEYDGEDAIPLEGVSESPDPDHVPNTAAVTGVAATVVAGGTGADGFAGDATGLVLGDTVGHGAASGGAEFVGAIGGDGFLLDAPDPHVGMLFDSLIDA